MTIHVDGAPQSVFIVQSGGATRNVTIGDDGKLAVGGNARIYFASEPAHHFNATLFYKAMLLGKRLSYTIDLSTMDCGCVAAFYLVEMPGYGRDGKPDKSTSGDYYCDANEVK